MHKLIKKNNKQLFKLLIALFLINYVSLLSAEPYFGLREGLKCSACHTNLTGGGKRTAFGAIYPRTLLNTTQEIFSPQLNNYLSFGANFRAGYTYRDFNEQEINQFEITRGDIYLEAVLNDNISFYLDQQVAPSGGLTKEAILILKGWVDSAYLKAGKMYLPYGLRLQDNSTFIRETTGYNMQNSDIGLEVGYEPGSWSSSIAISNGTQGGNENNKNKQVSLITSYQQPTYRIGFSFGTNKAPNELQSTSVNIFGGYNLAGFKLIDNTLDKINILAEIDFINQESGNTADIEQLATYIGLNYAYSKDTNIKIDYQYFDPNRDIGEDESTRFNITYERFFYQFFQLRAGIRILDSIPQNSARNYDDVFIELHVFF